MTFGNFLMTIVVKRISISEKFYLNGQFVSPDKVLLSASDE